MSVYYHFFINQNCSQFMQKKLIVACFSTAVRTGQPAYRPTAVNKQATRHNARPNPAGYEIDHHFNDRSPGSCTCIRKSAERYALRKRPDAETGFRQHRKANRLCCIQQERNTCRNQDRYFLRAEHAAEENFLDLVLKKDSRWAM